VYISDSARIKNSIIGPYVSISDDAVVEHSILRDCIISENAHIENRVMERSLVGKDARVSGTFQRMNVGDSLTASATVTGLERREKYGLVQLDVKFTNQHGVVAVPGAATVALPYRGGPAVPYPFVP
jgi:NDP-sugar pyrophosphorylase family protein